MLKHSATRLLSCSAPQLLSCSAPQLSRRFLSGVPQGFKALLVNKPDKKAPVERGVKEFKFEELPDYADGPEEVLVGVEYSSLNYKDGLVLNGKPGVVKEWPIVPGIDFAGTVLTSKSDQFKEGTPVVLTGWGVGEKRWGGYSTLARAKGSMLVSLPQPLSTADAMAVGTAGVTAMLCVNALEDAGVKPEQGPILVTGAQGGVGTAAIAILKAKGFSVAASTGRVSEAESLKALGASEVIDRSEFSDEEKYKPLLKERFAGAVDTVGGLTLSSVIAQTKYGGSVAACGLVGGLNIEKVTVAPFILRGVNLLGIDSVYASQAKRARAWAEIAQFLSPSALRAKGWVSEVSLDQLPDKADAILKGQVKGRVVVKVA